MLGRRGVSKEKVTGMNSSKKRLILEIPAIVYMNKCFIDSQYKYREVSDDSIG